MIANLAFCAVVFLFICDFFVGYNAQAVSTNPYDVVQTEVVRVHLADDSGTFFQRDWSLALAQKSSLPVHPNPTKISVNPDGPKVKKDSFTLYYRVIQSDEQVVIVPTTTPYALAMMVLAGLSLLFLRNMYVSGNPLHIQKRPRKRLKTLAAHGQPASTRKGGGIGPPPSRKPKGQGRRR